MQDTAQLHPIAIIAGTDLTAVGRTFLGNQTPFPLPVATSVDLCPNPLCVPQSKGWAGGRGGGCPQHCLLPQPFPFSPPPRDLCAERGLLHSPIAPHRPPHPPLPTGLHPLLQAQHLPLHRPALGARVGLRHRVRHHHPKAVQVLGRMGGVPLGCWMGSDPTLTPGAPQGSQGLPGPCSTACALHGQRTRAEGSGAAAAAPAVVPGSVDRGNVGERRPERPAGGPRADCPRAALLHLQPRPLGLHGGGR